MARSVPAGSVDQPSALKEAIALADRADRAACEAIADTTTPRLDRILVRVSNAANYSRLWLVTAAGVAVVGGARGRRAACEGLVSIALTSAVTNLAFKPLAGRRRPARSSDEPAAQSRRVRQPESGSFPSGHAASAFAFATATGEAMPSLRLPLRATATTVAYSRVHTGVHYPSDVVIGALVGELCGELAPRLARRLLRNAAAGCDSG